MKTFILLVVSCGVMASTLAPASGDQDPSGWDRGSALPNWERASEKLAATVEMKIPRLDVGAAAEIEIKAKKARIEDVETGRR